MMRRMLLTLGLALALLPTKAIAAPIIDFEGYATGVTNVSPATPYSEDGFTLTPLNSASAVFDSSAHTSSGFATDILGFAPGNTFTLTGPTPFSLISVLIGGLNGTTPDVTIVGNLSGGGTLSQTFLNLSTATSVTLNWANLTSATFTSARVNGAIDNVEVSTVPEPASLLLLGSGLAGAALKVRRRRNI